MKKEQSEVSGKDTQSIYAEILEALRNEDHSKGMPSSVRLSGETTREIEAEARLTRRTYSEVIINRMIFGLMPEAERDPHLRYRRRHFMPMIVEATDDALREQANFLRELVARAEVAGNEPQPHLREELRLCEAELDLREYERLHKKKVVLARQLGLVVSRDRRFLCK